VGGKVADAHTHLPACLPLNVALPCVMLKHMDYAWKISKLYHDTEFSRPLQPQSYRCLYAHSSSSARRPYSTLVLWVRFTHRLSLSCRGSAEFRVQGHAQTLVTGTSNMLWAFPISMLRCK